MDIITQAVNEAKRVREVNVRKVQKKVLEAISPKILEQVRIMEQGGSDDLGLGDILGGAGDGAAPAPEGEDALGGGTLGMDSEVPQDNPDDELFKNGIPQAITNGEKLVTAPEDGEQVEVTFDKLVDLMENGNTEIKSLKEDLNKIISEYWHVEEKDGKHCVTKNETGEPIKGGCHDTKEEANKHNSAININYKKEKDGSLDETISISQEDLLNTVMELMEEFTMNYKHTPHGHAGYATTEELDDFQLMDELLRKTEELQKKFKKANKDKSKLYESNKTLLTQFKDLRNQAIELAETLNDSSDTIQKLKENNNSIKAENDKLKLEYQKSRYIINVYRKDTLTSKQKDEAIAQILNAKTISEAQIVLKTVIGLADTKTNTEVKANKVSLNTSKGTLAEITAAASRAANQPLNENEKPRGSKKSSEDGVMGTLFENRQKLRAMANIPEDAD